MGKSQVVSHYEKKLLELLLRHELPEQCQVTIEVTPRTDDSRREVTGRTVFALRERGVIDVDARLDELDLKRSMPGPPCW